MSQEEEKLKDKIERLEKELKEKNAEIEEKDVVTVVLKLKARPRSLGFYRSRFNAPSKS